MGTQASTSFHYLKSYGCLSHLVWVKDHFLFPGHLFQGFVGDQIEMAGVGHIIEVIGGHTEHRAKGEPGDPGFIESIDLGEIPGADGALVFTVTLGNAFKPGWAPTRGDR